MVPWIGSRDPELPKEANAGQPARDLVAAASRISVTSAPMFFSSRMALAASASACCRPRITRNEEDHLVSLELGGHPRDPRNLWPERWGTPGHPLPHVGPFPAHLVGANAKDKTENALHAEVCHGTLTLREAQFIIATHWIKYYPDRVLK